MWSHEWKDMDESKIEAQKLELPIIDWPEGIEESKDISKFFRVNKTKETPFQLATRLMMEMQAGEDKETYAQHLIQIQDQIEHHMIKAQEKIAAEKKIPIQPQDRIIQQPESSRQSKILEITQAYEEEMAGRKKVLKRVKEINMELLEMTEAFQRKVLDKTDELEMLGQMTSIESKQFSKQVIAISEIVPPTQINTSIETLTNELNQKLVELNSKIKNLKSKNKKKVEKLTFEQRLAKLDCVS